MKQSGPTRAEVQLKPVDIDNETDMLTMSSVFSHHLSQTPTPGLWCPLVEAGGQLARLRNCPKASKALARHAHQGIGWCLQCPDVSQATPALPPLLCSAGLQLYLSSRQGDAMLDRHAAHWHATGGGVILNRGDWHANAWLQARFLKGDGRLQRLESVQPSNCGWNRVSPLNSHEGLHCMAPTLRISFPVVLLVPYPAHATRRVRHSRHLQ